MRILNYHRNKGQWLLNLVFQPLARSCHLLPRPGRLPAPKSGHSLRQLLVSNQTLSSLGRQNPARRRSRRTVAWLWKSLDQLPTGTKLQRTWMALRLPMTQHRQIWIPRTLLPRSRGGPVTKDTAMPDVTAAGEGAGSIGDATGDPNKSNDSTAPLTNGTAGVTS